MVVRGRPQVLVGVVAALGVLTACGSGGAQGPAAGTATTSTSYVSPLGDFLSPSSSGMPTSQEEYEAQDAKVQALIVPCMSEQGFQYTAFVYKSSSSGVEENLQGRAWTEKYGYGISTFDTQVEPTQPEQVDPNQAVMEAMSEGEREAYQVALYGEGSMMEYDESGNPIETASTEPSPTAEPLDEKAALQKQQGCWGVAQQEIYGGSMMVDAGDVDPFQDMWDSFNRSNEAASSAPAVVEATAAWVSCMAQAGHPEYTAPEQPSMQLNERWATLNGWDTGTGSGGSVSSAAESIPTEAPPSPPAAEVQTFRTEELATALVDYDCAESAGLTAKREEARIQVETKFLEEHRAELEQYRDAMNGGG